MRIIPDSWGADLREVNNKHEPKGTPDRNGDGRGDGGQFAHKDGGASAGKGDLSGTKVVGADGTDSGSESAGAKSPVKGADGWFTDPPEGYIRVYRGVNPERNEIDGDDETHGQWYTTTYDDAVSYANWDYEGDGGLGPGRAIRAVDLPLDEAFEYAKSGSRRKVKSADELLDDERPVELLVDADAARKSVLYEGDEAEGKRGSVRDPRDSSRR